jgi:hypothetical protein
MEALKFAFETTIVGLLALPWLALTLTFFLSRSQIQITKPKQEDNLLSKLFEPTGLSIAVLTLAYFMGSAILPISTQLLDDQDMPIRKIREIRADLDDAHIGWFGAESSLNAGNTPLSYAVAQFRKFCQEPTPVSSQPEQALPLEKRLISHKWWRSTDYQWKCWEKATDLFLIQQQLVLQERTEMSDRISRLYEQVIVLRGAVLNAFIFVSLSWFAYFSHEPHESIRAAGSHLVMLFGATISLRAFRSHWLPLFKALMLLGLVGLLMFVSITVGKPDVFGHDVRDPPIMESVLFVLGLIGIWAFFKGVEKGSHPLIVLLFSFALMLLAYGAWQWTEVLYTESVIAGFFARH